MFRGCWYSDRNCVFSAMDRPARMGLDGPCNQCSGRDSSLITRVRDKSVRRRLAPQNGGTTECQKS